jgi:branched-chain amino acid transport system permease protein
MRVATLALAICVVGAALLPVSGLLGRYGLYLMTLIAIYGIAATGLTLFMGYTGQLSIGQAAFYGIGAYAAADLTKAGLAFPLALLAGAMAAGLCGLAIGLVALRLRGFYLAVITLAAGLIGFQLFKNVDTLTGGVSGLGRIPSPALWGIRIGDPLSYCYLSLVLLLAVLLVASALVRSPSGRAMQAIAANELAARSIGIDSFRVKTVIFVLAAGFTGLAGGLYAHLVRFISPDDFTLALSIQFLTMAIIGGLNSVLGGLVGAVIVTLVAEQLRSFPALQPILFGVALLVVVAVMPTGVVGAVGRLAARWPRRGRTPPLAAAAVTKLR